MRLSLRLKSILHACQPGLPLWDLCCDHGYLGEAALHSGWFREVIFNDAVTHVLDELRPRLKDFPQSRIVCALAEDIAEPLMGNVVIAGIGGEKTARILNTLSENRFLQAQRLVLCPEKDAEWLAKQAIPGFCIQQSLRIPHNRGERWIYSYDSLRVVDQLTTTAPLRFHEASAGRTHAQIQQAGAKQSQE